MFGGVAFDQMAGYVFMCNTQTKPDCYLYRVFGLPASRIDVVENIKPGTNLFLFDTDLKLLYGMYVADISGKLAIEPYAFGGRFPAQVKFSIIRDCLPLPEVAFKDAIKENYHNRSKFKQELSAEQVNKLVSLFRPITLPLPPRLLPPYQSATGSLHPVQRGLGAQIARLPSHDQHTAGFGFADTQLRPCLSQSSLSQPSYQQFGSSSSHQPYHPDDPVLHHRDAHVSRVVPYVPAGSSYYGLNPVPSSAMPPSSLSASQWVAVASQAQTPGAQTSSFVLPSSIERSASYGSKSTDLTYQYHNQEYPSSYQEHSVINDPVHAHEQHPTSLSAYYPQSQGLIPEHQYQGYKSFHQTPTATVNHAVSNVPIHASETHPTYWTAAPSGYMSQQYPISQVTVPGASAAPVAGYVPAYPYGANPTY